jgi:hypothetical protein
MDSMKHPPVRSGRFTLRDLPLPARLTLAVMLISIGIGYVSALIQLHFQHSMPGSLLPTGDDAVRTFHGATGPKPLSRIQVLLEADENLPFTGSGQMSAAFTTRAESRWKKDIERKAKALKKTDDLAAAEQALRAERDGERLALLAWVEAGASKEDYQNNRFELPEQLAKRPITQKFAQEPGVVKIKEIIDLRCARCHAPDGEDPKAANFPLNDYQKLLPFVTPKEGATAMSLDKLAQTTHVHMLGFSMLYGITGLIFAYTSLPFFIRLLIAPLPLVIQVFDIACWWLARLEGDTGILFAKCIPITGGIVALGLLLHLLFGLWSLFGAPGRLVLILLFGAAAGGGFVAKQKVIEPFLANEKPAAGLQKKQ